MHYILAGKSYAESYADENGDFVPQIAAHQEICATAQASVADFVGIFQAIVHQGGEVLCLVISSRLSGAYSSACIAAKAVDAEKVRVVDSRTTAGGLALLLKRAAALIRQGYPLEDIVAQMRSIVGQEKPYANIPKLPELREKFMSCYVKILHQESAPVLDSIDQARSRVLEVLSTKEYNDQKRSTYFAQFQEIRDGAEHCNNVSSLRSYADKADALKLRLLNEMDALDNKLAQQRAAEEARRKAEEAKQSGTSTDEMEIAPAPVKIRKTKNVSIKMMTGTSS